jgi:predicted component of viral defense system (DUF524 family)
MKDLFCIETDKIGLKWSRNQDDDPVNFSNSISNGFFLIKPIREDLIFENETWRLTPSGKKETDTSNVIGPHIFEQTDYTLFIKSKTSEMITVKPQSPALKRNLKSFDGNRLIIGTINFGSQIGRSEFLINVGGKPELKVEIEVFPTKLDPKDYELILDEVQDIMTGLILEYLKSTFKIGSPKITPKSSHLEWLLLLRSQIEDLERALNYIAKHPKWGLTRESEDTRVERIKRPDSHIRRAIQRGFGKGKLIDIGKGMAVRERLEEKHVNHSLDTPEHRWLASQLVRIRRRLACLYLEESKREPGDRRDKSLNEISLMEKQLSRLSQLSPIREAKEAPPIGFASIQLQNAPGYREAYSACLILSLGLNVENGPISMSLKDLSVLYEYWCFLALLQLAAEVLDQEIPFKEMISIEQYGLRIRLQKGREQTIHFPLSNQQNLDIIYNPRFQGKNLLVPQQPDIVLCLNGPASHAVRFILDAKYRIDFSSEYIKRYGSAGPPEDALNVLYRYRGAIPDVDPNKGASIAHAIALFPYKETVPNEFRECRLWSAIETSNIGAIPILPNNTHYFAEWLHMILTQYGEDQIRSDLHVADPTSGRE